MRERAIIYGVGNNYQACKLKIFKNCDVIALADSRVGILVDGYLTISMGDIRNLQYDKIFITPSGDAKREIRRQLLELVDEKKIVEAEGDLSLLPPESVHMIDSRLFKKNISDEEKKMLFRDNVQCIYIELSSFCNRRCWFCPNKTIDRYSKKEFLSNDLIADIICQLKSIDYSNILLLTLNNEPLADDDLERKISLFKSGLPKCAIQIFTNSDYLTVERLKSLASAGLDKLYISVYISHHNSNENNIIPFDYNEAKSAICKLCSQFSIKPIFFNESNEHTVYAFFRFNGIDIVIHSRNLGKNIYSRGGLITNFQLQEFQSQPCIYPYHAFIIDYYGNVPLCNNVRVDHPTHEKFTVGNVKNNNIFDIYVDNFKAWRIKMLADTNYVEKPCCDCLFTAQDLYGLI